MNRQVYLLACYELGKLCVSRAIRSSLGKLDFGNGTTTRNFRIEEIQPRKLHDGLFLLGVDCYSLLNTPPVTNPV